MKDCPVINACPRLLDYIILVSRFDHSGDDCLVQDPRILRSFPNYSHDDFELPNEVKYFCQPEGCISSNKDSPESGPISFIFTLTNKDTGRIRFGITLNYYRICREFEPRDSSELKATVYSSGSAIRDNSTILTSICLISHHPFFSKFRECLHTLKHLMESCQSFADNVQHRENPSESIWLCLTKSADSNQIAGDSLDATLVQIIEAWILRLLSAPAPLPGYSYVSLSLLPVQLAQPLLFALPDKTRLTLVDFPLHLPLELLGVDMCLKVLTAIMLEQKVLLQSRDYNALTMSVMAFTAMLYPLQYMFPAIPLLPITLDGAENILLSPTPYLIGIPSNFLSEKKQFIIPPDVWLVDLDTNRMMGSAKLEILPPFPTQEDEQLRQHLESALSKMRTTNAAHNDTNAISEGIPADHKFHPDDDVDSVDVATRVAMIRFFNSANVLANLAEHTRTIRLYPVPVVAFQNYSFLKSRPVLTPFIQRLAQTQAVEYLSEWCLSPENEVFQRIHAGITDPQLIGDKPKWFIRALPQVHFDVWSDVGCPLLDNVVYWNTHVHNAGSNTIKQDYHIPLHRFEVSHFFNPPLTMEDQLRHAVKPTFPSHTRKKTRPRHSFESIRDETPLDVRALAAQATIDQSGGYDDTLGSSSSDQDDTDIWDLKGDPDAPQEVGGGIKRQIQRTGSEQRHFLPQHTDRMKVSHLGLSSVASTVNGLLPAEHQQNTDPNTANQPADDDQNFSTSERSGKPDQSSAAMEEEGNDDLLEEASLGKILFTNLSDNLVDAASQASSTLSGFLNAPKNIVKHSSRFARRIVAELKHDSSGSLNQTGNNIVISHSSATSKLQPTHHDFSSPQNLGFKQGSVKNFDDQLFLREVVQYGIDGRILDSSITTRLKQLLADENYRSYLICKLNTDLKSPPADPDESVQNMCLANQVVYNTIATVLQCVLRGLENTCTNHGIGGLASSTKLLEICHTHYVESPKPREAASTSDTVSRDNHNVTTQERRLSNRDETTLMDSFTGLFRSAARELRPKGSSIKTTLASPVTGLLSYANRLIKPNDADISRSPETGLFRSQPQSQLASDCVKKNDPFIKDTSESLSEEFVESPSLRSSSPDVVSVDGSDVNSGLFSEEPQHQTIPQKIHPTGSYRFVRGKLVQNDPEALGAPVAATLDSQRNSGHNGSRTYLYETLVRPKHRSRLWDHMQFWEDSFFDTVAQERDILGLDQDPMDALKRFATLSTEERKTLQNFEDRLLTICLHNLTACMVMMQVDKRVIVTRIRRIHARCRLGAHYSSWLSQLLDHVHCLDGNSIDLLPTMTKCNFRHSARVRKIFPTSPEVNSLEIYDRCVILRNITDAVVKKWALQNLLSVQLTPDKTTLNFRIAVDNNVVDESYYCDKAKQTHTVLLTVLEREGYLHKSRKRTNTLKLTFPWSSGSTDRKQN